MAKKRAAIEKPIVNEPERGRAGENRVLLLLQSTMIREIHVAGYRSIREVKFKLQAVNVLTGPNGCGKSNLYNSLTDRACRAGRISTSNG